MAKNFPLTMALVTLLAAVLAACTADARPTVALATDPPPTPQPVPTRVTPSPLPAATLVPASQTCVDAATFQTDVTIPDGAVIAPNMAFTKTWRLKNTGTCTWDSRYLVAYVSGATMTQQPGYWIVQPGQTVAPGQTIDISVGMTTPVEPGDYAAYWGLKTVDGPFMPIRGGANGNSFYVAIKVSGGVAAGHITAASIDIEPEQGSGPVCTANSTYLVHAHLTADGPTSAAYEIDSTAGQTPAGYFWSPDNSEPALSVTGSLVFDRAGTKAVNLRFVGPFPYPGDITVLLWVNRGAWYNAKLSCQ